MPSSTSLYSSTPGNANVASQNFTTLYSGSGTINPQQAYGNANVVSLLATSTDGGNTIGNILATGNVTADYFIGNGSQLTDINASNVIGNINFANTAGTAQFVTANAQANITSVGTLTALTVSGNVSGGNLITAGVASAASVSASGNITGNYFIGNGSQLTGLPATYGNANVAANLAAFATNPISTSGNITAGYFFGNGSGLTDINAGNIVGAYGNANVSNFLANGFGSNTITTTGNITSGNLVTAGNLFGNVVGQTFTGVGTANVTIRQFGLVGDGSALKLNANLVMVGGTAACTLVSPSGTNLELAASANVSAGGYIKLFESGTNSGNADIAGLTGGTIGSVNLYGNTHIGVGPVGIGSPAAKGNLIVANAVYVGESISATGNITANASSFFIGNGSQLTGIVSTYGNANVAANLAAFATNPISTSGNITAGYFFGNGSGLTDINAANIVGAYGNANVANFLGNGFGSNTITTTGNITAGNVIAPDVYTSNITGAAGQTVTITADGTGDIHLDADSIRIGDNNTAATLVTHGTGNLILRTHEGSAVEGNITVVNGVNGNIQLNPNGTGLVTTTAISASGNVDAGNLRTAGQVTATGNVSGGNVIVPINGRYYGDFTTGTASGRTVFQTTATGTSAATSLTAVPGPNHITSNTAFSSQINLFANGTDLGNSSFGRMQMFGNRLNFEATAAGTGAIGNMRFAAGSAQIVLLNTGNVGIGNANPNHAFSTNEGYFQGNISVTANVIAGNVNTAGEVSATGNVIGGNLLTGGAVTATGNITGANLVASANLTSTQQTVVGTANTGTTGNIVVSGKNIATDMLLSPDGGNAVTAQRGRVLIGTGFDGNGAHNAINHRLYVNDSITRSATANNAMQLFASDTQVSLTGNITGSSFRQQAVGSRLRIGGGSAANTINLTLTAGSTFNVAALQPNIDVGNASPYLLGNTSISQAVLNGGFITVNPASTVTHAYGMVPAVNSNGTVTNYIGFASQLALLGGSVTGNVYGMYHGSNATLSTTGISTNNAARAAPGYYAFYNADDVAQVKLGSLRSYNEFQFTGNSSGTWNIDKTNAQVQFISPTANVTIGDFQNFVTTANDSVNNDNQSDTVTLIIQQGATPYTVTMPTGNAAIKYLGGTTTVGSTANAVSVVTIRAVRSAANAALYLTAISSEYT